MSIAQAMGYSNEQIFGFKLIKEERIKYIGNMDGQPIETSSAEVHIYADNEGDRKTLKEIYGVKEAQREIKI